MKLKIKVRQKHIDNGKQKDSHHCMIADAIHEADPKARYVCVDLQSVRWSNLETGQRFVCFILFKAQASLLLFDNGIKPKPFSCTVHSAIIKKVGWKATHPHTDE